MTTLTDSERNILREFADVADFTTNRIREVAKARRAPDAEEIPEITFDMHQRGYGGLGNAQPRGIPQRHPVPSSGVGAAELAGESDYRDGDGTTNAADALSRELMRTKRDMRKLASEIENILLEESAEHDPNQSTWATGGGRDDVLAGHAMQRGSVSDLLASLTGKPKSMPIERIAPLAKSHAAISERIADASAAGDLSLPEELAAETLASMLPAASRDPRIGEVFAERLATAGPAVQRLFGV